MVVTLKHCFSRSEEDYFEGDDDDLDEVQDEVNYNLIYFSLYLLNFFLAVSLGLRALQLNPYIVLLV